jgi:hypothetical protein
LVTYLPFFPVVSQFAFGGLFMAFLSLYGRSASISLSWIFVAGMIVLLIANERFVTLYQRLSFQVATLFFTLLAFLAFYLPLVVHAIGIPVFLLSGAIAIALTACFLLVVYFAVPIFLREERFIVLRALLVVYLSWNLLYFSNIIPPLPLALKESGIFHAVTREGDAYLLTAEKKEWYEAYLPWRKEVYHRAPGESVYAYTAIYAPKDISTPITYEWQHYATTTREWATRAEISFIVRGGREGGYRAYSVKAVPEVGEWRVNVLLGDGRLLGRTAFTVVEASSSVSVIEEIR